jgi:hypothetical protein
MITADELAEWKRLCEEAGAPGPRFKTGATPDAPFVYAARDALPRLIAEVQETRKQMVEGIEVMTGLTDAIDILRAENERLNRVVEAARKLSAVDLPLEAIAPYSWRERKALREALDLRDTPKPKDTP